MTGLGLLKRRTEQERDQTKRQYGRGGGVMIGASYYCYHLFQLVILGWFWNHTSRYREGERQRQRERREES